jgi:hypothetical protein
MLDVQSSNPDPNTSDSEEFLMSVQSFQANACIFGGDMSLCYRYSFQNKYSQTKKIIVKQLRFT